MMANVADGRPGEAGVSREQPQAKGGVGDHEGSLPSERLT
jgi:hypothetical protein